jgi:DNA replication and repair protein RecF
MYISKIIIRYFRNIENLQFCPNNHFNIFFGKNAQGKTNILEAIYLLANLKSFRGAKNEDLIKHGQDNCYIDGSVFSNHVKREIKLEIYKNIKKPSIDNKKPNSASEFFSYLRPVLFSPEEVFLLKGYPIGRRSLLDRAVFQASPVYFNKVVEYNRFLKQRNKLLKEGKKLTETDPWTEGLVTAGVRVRLERKKYIERILPQFRETFLEITDGTESADIVYPIMGDSENELRHHFFKDLKKTAEREVIFGQTLVGPHRDDLLFQINGYPARQFGSQGQQRSFILAFKTSQIMDLEKIIGEPPILLLDDMTGELDMFRQKFFFNFLKRRQGQVFITTTDIQPLLKSGIKNGRFFRINQGEIQEIANNEEIQ